MRLPLPLPLEVAMARAAAALSRSVGAGGGTTVPGKAILRLDPRALERLAARLGDGAVLFSATNGKTTTTRLATLILRSSFTVVTNSAGANLPSGVASALLAGDAAGLAVLEVDEAALPEVAAAVRPRAVALGNLFRDQLDRYGELETLARRWEAAVGALGSETTLVVNADDPRVAALAVGHRGPVLRYGIDDAGLSLPGLAHAVDSARCPVCDHALTYDAIYAGHLGDYRCTACGHRRPTLDLVARDVGVRGLRSVDFELAAGGDAAAVSLPIPGLYNVYNALAAAAVALALGVPPAAAAAALDRAEPAFGRFERIRVGDRTAVMLLVKNPTAANEAVRALLAGDTPRVAAIAINDGIADGRDVSWIWDVDWEPLLDRLDHVVATGDRAAELALRLVYAGFPRDRLEVEPVLEAAFDRALGLAAPGEEVAVLPTYTAMLSLRDTLAGRGLVRPFWEAPA